MRTFYNYLLVCAIAAVPAAFVANAQTAAQAGSAAASPNNWQKEYADGMTAYNSGNYREARSNSRLPSNPAGTSLLTILS